MTVMCPIFYIPPKIFICTQLCSFILVKA